MKDNKKKYQVPLHKPLPVDRVIGVKFDQNKPRWGLLPFDAVKELVKVLTFGAEKYAPNNWKKIDNAHNRYMDAMMRHITAWWEGEKNDSESGLHHLAHAGCCLLFLLWFELSVSASPKSQNCINHPDEAH